MNKKGLSVVELIVAFVLCILVFVFIMQVVSSIEELHLNLGVKTELLNKQSLISEKINEKLNNNIVLIKKCGEDCFTFIYKNNTFDKMEINKTNNTFSFGSDVYNFDNLGTVSSLTMENKNDKAYHYGILTINLDIKNSIFESGEYLIKAYYQYNENNTIYTEANIDKPEIFLFGSNDYDFSNNKFNEPGWIVYYPTGEVSVNGSDVIASEIQYDSKGYAYITYTGINTASGATARRDLKKILKAKEYFLNLYEDNGLYLYAGTGKYVYKGSKPNNYILVGNKLFRILALEIQNNYKLNNNSIVITNGEKQLEDKYLLKVVSNDYLPDSSKNTNLKYGIDTDGFTTSAWIKNANTKYANRLAQAYLNELINTGSGSFQIKNGIFNIGLIDSEEYNFTISQEAKRVFDQEGLDYNDDPGTWSGCTETKCEPNAALLSLTDLLFAGSCQENISINCLTDNYLLDSNLIRLMTRSSENETWVLNGNNLVTRGISSELKSKVTLYVDANLYIFGEGTIENPYILYNLND